MTPEDFRGAWCAVHRAFHVCAYAGSVRDASRELATFVDVRTHIVRALDTIHAAGFAHAPHADRTGDAWRAVRAEYGPVSDLLIALDERGKSAFGYTAYCEAAAAAAAEGTHNA